MGSNIVVIHWLNVVELVSRRCKRHPGCEKVGAISSFHVEWKVGRHGRWRRGEDIVHRRGERRAEVH